jgi:hypothetical protein
MNQPISVSVSKWLIAIGTLLLSLVNLSVLTTLGYKPILGVFSGLIILIGCIFLLIGVKDSRWRIFAGVFTAANIASVIYYYLSYRYINFLVTFDLNVDTHAEYEAISDSMRQTNYIVASICNILSFVSVAFIFNMGSDRFKKCAYALFFAQFSYTFLWSLVSRYLLSDMFNPTIDITSDSWLTASKSVYNVIEPILLILLSIILFRIISLYELNEGTSEQPISWKGIFLSKVTFSTVIAIVLYYVVLFTSVYLVYLKS